MIRAALVALALTATGAHAAEPVEGAWTFATAHYRVHEEGGLRTYTMVRGTLTVAPGAGGAHPCEMRTEQSWYEQKKNAKPIVTDSQTSVQTCTLTQNDDGKITIVGEIVSASSEDYRADDFTLTLESASRMSGQMHSRWSDGQPVAKAAFQRGGGEIS